LGSYCLVAITGYGSGIIYNPDDKDDDATPVLSMFILLVMLITRLHILIGTWRTTQENSATTILYGSSLG
jgi:hypothetical protein